MKQKKELTPEEKKRANKVALFGCLPIIIIGIALIFFASNSSDKKRRLVQKWLILFHRIM